VQAFGVIGLVIGPLVFSLLMSIIGIYKQVMLKTRLAIAAPSGQSQVS
jgi:predicted PurR-regulated permease PerM